MTFQGITMLRFIINSNNNNDNTEFATFIYILCLSSPVILHNQNQSVNQSINQSIYTICLHVRMYILICLS